MANEKRLIDANALISHIEKQYCIPCKANGQDYHEVRCRACWVDDMRLEVEAVPTVDAVEVVRCKGCKHWLHVEEGFGDCTNPRFHLDGHADPTMNADDFCSCGERRENNA